MKRLTFLAFMLVVLHASPMPVKEPKAVVVTTSWTAAFAQAAGITDFALLAPYEIQHPPEYELKPSDIEMVANAELIIFGGYEVMVQKLKEVAGRQDTVLLQIPTDYSMATIEASLRRIAEEAGTQEKAEKSIMEIRGLYEEWRKMLESEGIRGAPVLVHHFQKPLAEELGFDVKGTFGPGPLEAAQIAKLSREKVRFIIDNRHNEVGKLLMQTVKDASYISLINFPGLDGTRSLLDVIKANRRTLMGGGAER